MAKNFVDLCRHGFTVVQGLNAGGASRACLLSCRSRSVVDGRRLSNPSCARRRNNPYGYRMPATHHRDRSKKACVSHSQAPESTKGTPYCSVKLILILISDCSKVAKFVPQRHARTSNTRCLRNTTSLQTST